MALKLKEVSFTSLVSGVKLGNNLKHEQVKISLISSYSHKVDWLKITMKYFMNIKFFIKKLIGKYKVSPHKIINQSDAIWIVINDGTQLLYVDQFNSVTNIILDLGAYEEKELDLVRLNVPDDGVFFDIGANVGLFSLVIARAKRNAIIHAFEPVPDTILTFQKNIDRNNIPHNRIRINPMAVGAKKGSTYITTDFHSSNYETSEETEQNHLKIDCITLDEYVSINDFPRIDFIKIDVEGKEYSVLKGAEFLLTKYKPNILVEIAENLGKFYDREIEDSHQSIRFLTEKGYQYYVIDDTNQLIFMDSLDKGNFKKPYHNYLFFQDNQIKLS